VTNSPAFSDVDFAAARAAMVDSQLRTNAVDNPQLVAAMRIVPREAFVPASHRAVAYIDRAIPLDGGRALNPPMTTALLLDAAEIGDGDHVLIVGDATGYAAAIAAHLTGNMTELDSEAALAGQFPDGLRYDAIVIDGAVEAVPDNLVALLAPSGRMAAGVVEHGVTRLAVGRKGGHGFALIPFVDTEVVVLPAFARPKEFVF